MIPKPWSPRHSGVALGAIVTYEVDHLSDAVAFGLKATTLDRVGNRAGEEKPMSFAITSTAFAPNGAIPSLYTCEGRDISPPLSWSGAPSATRSFALIVDDPDAPDPAAPKMTWVHWVLYNIAVPANGLPEAAKPNALPPGTCEGLNDWNRTSYGGPCPPIGRHRYFHKLYALDTVLPDLKLPRKAAIEKAMQGHILAEAVLIGTYHKHR